MIFKVSVLLLLVSIVAELMFVNINLGVIYQHMPHL